MERKCFEQVLQAALVLSLLLIAGYPCFPQSPDGPDTVSPGTVDETSRPYLPTRQDLLRVSVDLVMVPVTVTDAMNHPKTDLNQENFTVFDEGKAQQIRYFSTEDSPISVGLLLDVSNSMQNKIETERAALEEFFRNANPEDDYFAITFNNRPRVLSDVTRSIAGIETELGLVQPSGSTALLDAVSLGIAKLQKARYPRRALVIISDGGDNASRYKLKEIKSLVAESDVMVYAIGVFDSALFKSFEEAMGKRWLSAMTDVTGGRTTTVETLAKVPEALARLSRELRSQYVLGYLPRDPTADGKWHRIKIVVASRSADDQFRPYYKRGYYAFKP